jgi:hypothetical protein
LLQFISFYTGPSSSPVSPITTPAIQAEKQNKIEPHTPKELFPLNVRIRKGSEQTVAFHQIFSSPYQIQRCPPVGVILRRFFFHPASKRVSFS